LVFQNFRLDLRKVSKKKALVIGLAVLALGAIILNWNAIECAAILMLNPSAHDQVCFAALG